MAITLVRHARAGKRSAWSGDDRQRPLDERGERQAFGLVSAFSGRPVKRILSSPYLRCLQTVQPLAADRGLDVEERPELAEGAGRHAAEGLVAELANSDAVLCTHGDIVEALVGHDLKKGAAWVLDSSNELKPVEYVPPGY